MYMTVYKQYLDTVSLKMWQVKVGEKSNTTVILIVTFTVTLTMH